MLYVRMIINWFCYVLNVFIFIHVVISWLPIPRDNFIVQIVLMVTEPILDPIRQLLDRSPLGGSGMMLDFSPILAIFLIDLVRKLVLSVL